MNQDNQRQWMIVPGEETLAWVRSVLRPGDAVCCATFQAGIGLVGLLTSEAGSKGSSIRIISDASALDWQDVARLGRRAGVNLEWRVYPMPPGPNPDQRPLFHPKMVIVGDHSVLIGSANLTRRAWGVGQAPFNVELGVAISGPSEGPVLRECQAVYDQWWELALPATATKAQEMDVEGKMNREDVDFITFTNQSWGVGQVSHVRRTGLLGGVDVYVALSDLMHDQFSDERDYRRADNLLEAADPQVLGLLSGQFAAYDESGIGSMRERNRSHLRRLCAYWLQDENRQGQLDNTPVLPLRHQVSLVEFLLRPTTSRHMLIADEVGLGKTVEIGLLLKRLLNAQPNLRILYLTLGGLVKNVAHEFRRIGLPQFTVYGNGQAVEEHGAARLGQHWERHDTRVVASIHKLGHGENADVLQGSTWDVLVVDECHKLRAYGADDTFRAQQWFRLVENILQQNLAAPSRCYFLSGTPHQGNDEVFLNLAGLLHRLSRQAPLDQKREALRGTVVYRIKEEARDWDGYPLFPDRDIREPLRTPMPAGYNELLNDIRDHFTWLLAQSNSRAIGFVQSQALQLAASSPKAGFLFLLRRYLRYFSDTYRGRDALTTWTAHLSPYRDQVWAPDQLLDFLQRDVATAPTADPEMDFEDNPEDRDPDEEATLGVGPDAGAGRSEEETRLGGLLDRYARLLQSPEARSKFERLLALVLEADEPFVVFAQSVDTVYEIARTLSGAGVPVRVLVGGQNDSRESLIEWFRQGGSSGRRVLVSSAAGGEGINLQVASRLIHFDLPWNPMVLEQRIGRIHRVGAVKTIRVDTILLAGSREAEIYSRLLDRLSAIVRAMNVSPEVQAQRFRRILSGIPLETLRELFTGFRIDGLDNAVGAAVQQGWDALSLVDEELSALRQIWSDDTGLAQMEDLERLLLNARMIEPYGADLDWAEVQWNTDKKQLNVVNRHCPRYRLRDPGRAHQSSVENSSLVVFDRTGAASAGLTTQQTAGINHPLLSRGLQQIRVPAEQVLRSIMLGHAEVPNDLWEQWVGPGEEIAVLFTYLSGRLAVDLGAVEERRLTYRIACPTRAVAQPDREGIQRMFWQNLERQLKSPKALAPQVATQFQEQEAAFRRELLSQTIDDNGLPVGALWPIAATLLTPGHFEEKKPGCPEGI